MTRRDQPSILGTNQAMATLAYAALCQLWASADFQPGGEGCCHKCCDTCAALRFLDEKGVLDEILSHWPEAAVGDDMFLPDGKLDRVWVYRQWSGSNAQEQCGHRLLADPLGAPVGSAERARAAAEKLPTVGCWSAMIPDPHPPGNCGPLAFNLPAGSHCPTCGTVTP